MNGHRQLVVVGTAWAALLAAVVAGELRDGLGRAREVPAYETARAGDFNGDGKTDIATFTRDNPKAVGKAYVALSDGAQFLNKRGRRGRGTLWNDWFAISSSEQILVGDFDGDGRDDLATWLGPSTHAVYVALSTGSRFSEAAVWARDVGFDVYDSVIAADVNGDGRDDVVCFSPGSGRITISYSNGTSFAPPETELFEMH